MGEWEIKDFAKVRFPPYLSKGEGEKKPILPRAPFGRGEREKSGGRGAGLKDKRGPGEKKRTIGRVEEITSGIRLSYAHPPSHPPTIARSPFSNRGHSPTELGGCETGFADDAVCRTIGHKAAAADAAVRIERERDRGAVRGEKERLRLSVFRIRRRRRQYTTHSEGQCPDERCTTAAAHD